MSRGQDCRGAAAAAAEERRRVGEHERRAVDRNVYKFSQGCQIGINVPTASLDALGANMDELTSSLFEMALDGVEDLVESAGSKVKEMMHNAADNAEAAMEMMKHPETALIGLMDSEEIKQAGRSQYMLFKTWLDEKYKGWQGRIGLEPKVNSEGQVEWLPP